jgi:hypothetical protein
MCYSASSLEWSQSRQNLRTRKSYTAPQPSERSNDMIESYLLNFYSVQYGTCKI